jgi:hypothetical protein
MTGKTFSFEINRPAGATATAGPNGRNRLSSNHVGSSTAPTAIGMWPMLMREKTIAYEPDRRHVYAQIGPPLPAKNYQAELLLTPMRRAAPICAGPARSSRGCAGRVR